MTKNEDINCDDLLTLGSRIFSHLGLIKYTIPFQAPSSVKARINKMPMTTYGNKARK